MKDDGIADFLSILSFATPLALCAMVVAYYNCLLITKQGWRAREVMLYDGVSVATGILAGLVGIGGGLIISPFLIVMNLEPSVAVATSSTCVIFTSSSTTPATAYERGSDAFPPILCSICFNRLRPK